MKKTVLLAVLGITYGTCQAQKKEASQYNVSGDYVLVDARMIRGQMGYEQLSIRQFDTFPVRSAGCFNVKAEFRMFSSLIDKYNEFVVHDAMYIDMSMGKMNSAPLSTTGVTKEGKFAVRTSFGYDFLAGYRNKRIGVLAGLRPTWQYTFIGDVNVEGKSLGFFVYTAPVAIKTEYCFGFNHEFRIMCTAWKTMWGNSKRAGLRLEVPIHPRKRWFIFGEYDQLQNPASYVFGNRPNTARTNSLLLGMRFGSVY